MTPNSYKELGDEYKARIKALGLNQEQTALLLGLTRTALNLQLNAKDNMHVQPYMISLVHFAETLNNLDSEVFQNEVKNLLTLLKEMKEKESL